MFEHLCHSNLCTAHLLSCSFQLLKDHGQCPASLLYKRNNINNRINDCNLIWFIILVPPPPAFFTKVVNVTSVQVLWELPNKPGKTEGFRLSYRRVPHGEFQGPLQMSCHTNAQTIVHLGKCRSVCVCIIYGPMSELFQIQSSTAIATAIWMAVSEPLSLELY